VSRGKENETKKFTQLYGARLILPVVNDASRGICSRVFRSCQHTVAAAAVASPHHRL